MVVRLAFGGDAMLGRLFNEKFRVATPAEVWAEGRAAWDDADFLAVNLETTLSKFHTPAHKMFTFRLAPRFASALTAAGIGFVSLANNHMLDFGVAGLAETLAHLPPEIAHAGAGMNAAEAMRPAIVEVRGVRVGFVAAANHHAAWAAGPTQPGIFWFSYANPAPLLAVVAACRPQVDVLVVALHWGANWELPVDVKRQRLAHRLAAAGADIIHGHSAHHVQPIERIGQSLVAYSLGTFIDDYAIEPAYRSDLGAVLRVEFARGRGLVGWGVTPIAVRNLEVVRPSPADDEFVFAQMQIPPGHCRRMPPSTANPRATA